MSLIGLVVMGFLFATELRAYMVPSLETSIELDDNAEKKSRRRRKQRRSFVLQSEESSFASSSSSSQSSCCLGKKVMNFLFSI